jgi:hypothetical protein
MWNDTWLRNWTHKTHAPSVVWYVRSEGVSWGVCGGENCRLLWGCARYLRAVQIRAALLCFQGCLCWWGIATKACPHGSQCQSPHVRWDIVLHILFISGSNWLTKFGTQMSQLRVYVLEHGKQQAWPSRETNLTVGWTAAESVLDCQMDADIFLSSTGFRLTLRLNQSSG